MIYVAASLALCMSIVAFVAVNECRILRQKRLDLFRQLVRQQETLSRALKDNIRLKIALAPFASKPATAHEPPEWGAARAALNIRA